MSIRSKITLIVLVLLALMGVSFALYSINTTENYKRLRVEGVKKTVQSATEQVNKTIRAMERNAIDLANSGKLLLASGNRSDQAGDGIVVENFDSFPASVGGGIWYEPGKFHEGVRLACHYALRDEKTGEVGIDPNFASERYDYPTQSWYTEIAAAARLPHATAWTRPYYDDTGSFALMTTVGAGIFDSGGKFAGMSTVDWEIDSVIETLTTIKPTPNSFVLLAVPKEDYVITNTSDGSAGGSPKNIDWYENINLPERGKISVDPITHRKVNYLAFSQITDNGWLISVPIPRDEIFSEIEKRNRDYSIIICLSSLALLGIAWWLVSRLVNKPISRLIRDVEKVGQGKLDTKIEIGSDDEIGRLGSAFNKMTVDLRDSLEKSHRERAERERIAGELDAATQIQTSMLPCIFPAFPERGEFDIYASMFPAREVGGDFYDFFLVDDKKRLCAVIADVSGKGVPAALFMVIARTLIKNNAQSGKSPAEVFEAVNNLLCENNDAGMFVTAFMGYLDMDTGIFRYVNAGHNPPMVCRAGECFNELHVIASPMLAAVEDLRYEEEQLRLEPGDTLFLYTDGVTEAKDASLQMFGTTRCKASLEERKEESLQDLLSGLKKDIDAFAGDVEQADDITMLALRMRELRK